MVKISTATMNLGARISDDIPTLIQSLASQPPNWDKLEKEEFDKTVLSKNTPAILTKLSINSMDIVSAAAVHYGQALLILFDSILSIILIYNSISWSVSTRKKNELTTRLKMQVLCLVGLIDKFEMGAAIPQPYMEALIYIFNSFTNYNTRKMNLIIKMILETRSKEELLKILNEVNSPCPIKDIQALHTNFARLASSNREVEESSAIGVIFYANEPEVSMEVRDLYYNELSYPIEMDQLEDNLTEMYRNPEEVVASIKDIQRYNDKPDSLLNMCKAQAWHKVVPDPVIKNWEVFMADFSNVVYSRLDCEIQNEFDRVVKIDRIHRAIYVVAYRMFCVLPKYGLCRCALAKFSAGLIYAGKKIEYQIQKDKLGSDINSVAYRLVLQLSALYKDGRDEGNKRHRGKKRR